MTQKWKALLCFGLAAGLSQLLWLNFAPILTLVQSKYGVSESQAGLLLLVFPLIYVFLSVHAGSLTDRKGYRVSLLFGTALMAVFACLRIEVRSFWWLLATQVGIAVAQPYVVNSISKLVLDWFEKDQEALATGLGTMGLFVGMAVGLAATPPLVERWGLQGAMIFFATISVAVFVTCYFGVQPRSSLRSQASQKPSFRGDLKKLVGKKDLLTVFGVSFLGLGYFNGLTTWLEPILAPQGLSSLQAGIVGGTLILGGIAGSAVIPALSDHFKKRKPLLLLCILIGGATLYPLTVSKSLNAALIWAGIQGFFFLPAFALLLEMASEIAGAGLAGSATGLLMLAGNAGAVVVIVAMELVKGDSPTFEKAVLLLLFLLAIALIASMQVRETFSRKK